MPRTPTPSTAPVDRLASIAMARHGLLAGQVSGGGTALAGWVERSWQRCLSMGLQPERSASFDLLPREQMRRTLDANAHLIQTARPLLESLGKAIGNTGYFAILTNPHGVVVDARGAIDRSDARADVITRVGTDLSERSVGTTAIGTALAELQPVWLHRGEHFHANTAIYSCAGAPLFGPDGACAGMLDLTGIDVTERAELKHLVTQVASRIESALVLAQEHAITLRLNWPGNALGGPGDGLICLDADGHVTGANTVARQIVPGLEPGHSPHPHVSSLFGMEPDVLFDAARQPERVLDLPLWNGLLLQGVALQKAFESVPQRLRAPAPSRSTSHLKDIETELILQAVQAARGNVAKAAEALGISRATVYRKLGRKPH